MRDKIYGKQAKNYELYPCKELYTLKELLSYAVQMHAGKTAFQFEEDGNTVGVSYEQFFSHVNALGTWLFSRDLQNTHIAVYGENSYAWIVVYFAVTCGNNVIVPIDRDASPEDFAYYLENSDCSAIFYSDTYADLPENLSQVIARFNLKQLPEMLAQGQRLLDDGFRSFPEAEPKPEDLASIVYTSGTTGKPKGVMLSHRNFCACACGCFRHLKSNGPQLLVLPLHHVYGIVTVVFCMLLHGYPVCINLSLRNLSADFRRYNPQCVVAVPLLVETLHHTIWFTAKRQKKDKQLLCLLNISRFFLRFGVDLRRTLFRSIRTAFGSQFDGLICGGAFLDEKYITDFYSLGIKVLNGYGITECGPVVAVNREFYMVPGSVGTPLCCNQVKIAENGEVLVKGDNVMLGYYHMPEETASVMADGWFHTGDLGRIDENGVLYITGRLKNLIILGNGENIPAEEIERYLYSIPYVKEALAYGEGNTIVAELFLDESFANARTEIGDDINRLNLKIPQNRNIGKIIIRDREFPKTTSRKIKR